MAKAQTVKPKSSFADWFKRASAPKAKPAARPGASASSSTLTNIAAAGASATRPGTPARAAGARPPAAKVERPGATLATFRVPFVGDKPITKQMQILGALALVLMLLTAGAVYMDTRSRTQSA
ncbi:MAG: hypothetical protein ACXWLR_09985, partial [Myxococcales bacterium]